MGPSRQTDWPTVIAGFGSPHGDDQAGWSVVARLAERPGLPARVIRVYEPTQVLAALGGCRRLIAVDACHSSGRAGDITRLAWPDPRIGVKHSHSTHGVGVVDVLKLAEQLGDLPPAVEIFGIEVADCSPGRDMSPEVGEAVAMVTDSILSELREVAHA